jgi:hypothetical protein
LINTLEWLDDKSINIDIAEKLIFVEYKKYMLKDNHENIYKHQALA